MAMHVSETEVATLVFEREPFVVDPEKVLEGGMQVMHVHAVLDDIVAVVVGYPVRVARAHSTAGHPHGEAARVMVPAEVIGGHLALAVVGAAEFAAPDNKGIIEHAAHFQILNEGGGRLVSFLGLFPNIFREIRVSVPALLKDLNEAHALFREATGEQAIGGEGAGCGGIFAVEVESRRGFVAEVGHLGDGGLHAERHLVLSDVIFECRVAGFGELFLVKLLQVLDGGVTTAAADSLGVVEIKHGVLVGAELNAVVLVG